MGDVITLVAVALAVLFAGLAWHFSRLERRRSDARVRALTAALDGTAPSPSGRPLFATAAAQPRGAAGPLLKVAAGFGLAVLVIVAIAMSGSRPQAPAVAEPAGGSLELLSMRHDREGETLTVTGLVRNADAAPAAGITAVVFAFDREGGFVASGSAPLTLAPLAPGDESPFTVAIPDLEDVGRYRVSFRSSDGVVRHVDRRDREPVATSGGRLAAAPRITS